MSDIPSGALDAAESRAVSLLARVILPRPGEPLDVRKLYIEESKTNAKRAHAPTRTTLEIGAESEVSFATYFNAFPASYWRRWSTLESVVLRVELTGSARVDVYRSKATGARITVGGAPISSGDVRRCRRSIEFEIGLDPFEDGGWIWFDITTDSKVTVHSAGWYAPAPAPGRANIAVGIPTFNRPSDCVNALAALTSDPLVDKVIGAVIVSDQGTKKAVRPPRLRRGRRPAGQPAVHSQPAQPRRLRRLQPGDVRGAEEHRLRTDPVHGRRHPHRAGLDPARAGDEPVRQGADARRRPDAQPAGAVAPARDGRDCRPGELHVDRGAAHRVRPRLRQVPAQRRRGAAASSCTAASTSTTTAGGCA